MVSFCPDVKEDFVYSYKSRFNKQYISTREPFMVPGLIIKPVNRCRNNNWIYYPWLGIYEVLVKILSMLQSENIQHCNSAGELLFIGILKKR